MTETIEGHGGDLALATLRGFGIKELFTLSGGHIFPLYDAAQRLGVRLLDVRHEQSAVFAAEAVAKLQRRPAVAALTAGPGVTNGISALTTAQFNGSPVLVFGGRAPSWRWGAGSLQELDHVPLVSSVTKVAGTVLDTEDVVRDVHAAALAAISGHKGPAFLDFPLEVLFSREEVTLPELYAAEVTEADPADVAKAAVLLAGASRPMIIAGSDVYTGDAIDALRAAAENLRVPVYTNGMGRGALPPEHELAFSKSRRAALSDADVVCVIGTPLDFRLNFGEFGDAALIHVVDDPSQRAGHVEPSVSPAGDLRLTLTALADHSGARADHEDWIEQLREVEDAARAGEKAALEADGDLIVPSRIYGELRKVLDRDAVTIGDGGDFVSYAGKYLEPATPGCWLDPGPYGCLGTGMGYAMGARYTYPDRQICVLMGDGAAGFSLMDVESLVRQDLPVVIVVGNNGIWGLEKHPMNQLYGYDVVADLQPGLRYDEVVKGLGGAGETVAKAADIGPALKRAFASGVPYLVNILTDPADAYPRSSNLA
ncbi:acetolactate synthase [Longispora albida]|uniref:acetolactate synthase n=1 Tax=Longispora albida TaxID=203523 RepID=UPI00036F0FD2|nr:acetolactate synthase [Longispora albida]